MAFRREVLAAVGGFDEKFRWYRTADIEWSFRVKDAGLRCAVVPVPVTKHEHRAWAAATEDERASRSKRNFYRFLDRWRDRWDLVLSGEPEHHDHDDDHRSRARRPGHDAGRSVARPQSAGIGGAGGMNGAGVGLG